MKKSFYQITLAGLLLTTVTACQHNINTSIRPSMFEDTEIVNRPINVEENYFVAKKPTEEINHSYLNSLVNDYTRHGSSPIYIVMTYDPEQKNAKLNAFNTRNVMKGQLAKMGIRDAVIKTIPIEGGINESIIGYDRISARGPDNCGVMPGTNQRQTGSYGNYALGCTVKDLEARQVAYPADLLGTSTMDGFDADRAAAIVVRDTRSGEQQDFVPGYVLSEVGGGG
jgi:pilus assembly protein CpaD